MERNLASGMRAGRWVYLPPKIKSALLAVLRCYEWELARRVWAEHMLEVLVVSLF